MPLLTIITNKAVPAADHTVMLKAFSETVAEMLGKPEQYVMVSYQHNPDMLFAGTNEPLAYLELKSIGLPEAQTAELSSTLAAIVSQHLQVSTDRLYIEFSGAERHMWGWNGGTFA